MPPISHEQLTENEKFDADSNAGIADEGDQIEQTTATIENAPLGPGNETPEEKPAISAGFRIQF